MTDAARSRPRTAAIVQGPGTLAFQLRGRSTSRAIVVGSAATPALAGITVTFLVSGVAIARVEIHIAALRELLIPVAGSTFEGLEIPCESTGASTARELE